MYAFTITIKDDAVVSVENDVFMNTVVMRRGIGDAVAPVVAALVAFVERVEHSQLQRLTA